MKTRSLWRPIGVGILLGVIGPIRPVGVGNDALALGGAVHAEPTLEILGRSEPARQPPVELVLRVLSSAEGLLRLGRPDAAAELARRLPTTGPHGDAVLRVRAWALMRSDGLAELADLLADHEPLVGELLFLRGAGRLHGEEPKAGRRDLQQLWWDEPEGAWGLAALRELAEVPGLYGAKERRLIKHHLQRATSSVVGPARGGGSGQSLLDALIRDTPSRTRLGAELQQATGIRLTRAEDFTAAVATLIEAKRSTNDSELRRAIELRLGEAERRRGRLSSAARCFDAVASSGDDALALEALASAGQMFIEYRRYDEARRRFESQLVTNPVGPTRRQALKGLGWVAYRTGDFIAARRFFEALRDEDPFGELAPGAVYWAARALEEMGGDRERVQAELVGLARRFPVSYYAYRATERLGRPPWPSADGVLPPEELTPPAEHVAELVKLGMARRVRKELRQILEATDTNMGPRSLTEMAEAAVDVGQPGVASRFLYRRNRRFPDGTAATIAPLARQFPATYVDLVSGEAKRQGVNRDLVVALVRQESGFRADVSSPVGALGLMQLMPATARDLMREHNRRAHPTAAQILVPETNARLGVRYLGRMLRAFGNRAELALAAYNAGPGAVTRWRQGRGDLPAEIFVEEIPYRETNLYVRKVLAWRQALRLIELSKLDPGHLDLLAAKAR